MINRTIFSIFKRGSKTYFYSSLFYPKEVRKDVFILYSFLRKADDYVDSIPQQKEGFYKFKSLYEDSIEGKRTGNIILDSFAELTKRKNFDPTWGKAFLNSMEMDLYKSTYENIDELSTYLYGSSEVVGLFMARILDLPDESLDSARHLGKAMQYLNFIRDIAEDIELKRVYFPQEDLRRFKIHHLEEDYVKSNPEGFKQFIRKQLETYYSWQEKAEEGFKYMPLRCLISIKTASDMYKWTGKRIEKNPFIVYERKVKPTIPFILSNIFYNSVKLSLLR